MRYIKKLAPKRIRGISLLQIMGLVILLGVVITVAYWYTHR